MFSLWLNPLVDIDVSWRMLLHWIKLIIFALLPFFYTEKDQKMLLAALWCLLFSLLLLNRNTLPLILSNYNVCRNIARKKTRNMPVAQKNVVCFARVVRVLNDFIIKYIFIFILSFIWSTIQKWVRTCIMLAIRE
jgi:hypothetical protein